MTSHHMQMLETGSRDMKKQINNDLKMKNSVKLKENL